MQPNIYAVRRCRGPRKRNQESCRNFSGTCAVINSILKRNWKFLNSGAKSADQWLLGYAHSMRANPRRSQTPKNYSAGQFEELAPILILSEQYLWLRKNSLGFVKRDENVVVGFLCWLFPRFVNILRISNLNCWYLFSLLLCYLKTLC